MTWFLNISDTTGKRGLALDETATYSIGRTSSADIRLANEFVSGQHGRLEPLTDKLGYLFIDTSSRNGSFTAQGNLVKTVRLRVNEPVYLGSKQVSLTLVRSESLSASDRAILLKQVSPPPSTQPTRLWNLPATA